MMKIIKEFKEFALRGNVIDLAVGVIIASAFGAIVTSLTNDVIMPPIGWLIGGIDFSDLTVSLPQKMIAGKETVVTIAYGKFIQTIINFLIVAASIFFAVKFMNKLKRKETEIPAAPAEPIPTNEETLLTEIRDLMKKQSEK